MIIALMDTRHYSWIASGDTKKQAKRAMFDGFMRTFEEGENNTDDMSFEYFNSEFGDSINFIEINSGEAFRDCEKI